MKNKHLTLEDRKVIQEGIEQGLSKTAIAKSLSKDPSTVSKEIMRYRTRKTRKLFNRSIPCVHLKTCEEKTQTAAPLTAVITNNGAVYAETVLLAHVITVPRSTPVFWIITSTMQQKHTKYTSIIFLIPDRALIFHILKPER